jgi:hypothetical protein
MHRIAVQRKQTLTGSLSQTAAASGHNVPPAKLTQLDAIIPKTLILTGDEDYLVKPVNSEWLHKHMPRAEYQVWNGYGHGLVGQDPAKFNALLERVVKEGRDCVHVVPPCPQDPGTVAFDRINKSTKQPNPRPNHTDHAPCNTPRRPAPIAAHPATGPIAL